MNIVCNFMGEIIGGVYGSGTNRKELDWAFASCREMRDLDSR